ncbi:MAG: cyclic pyranopterin monophosphate synthase MoaC, partial [Candidatus Omnitrophica bacterium]|nr:cyclic pyranopterin monophosphate synthase MoaC [Candidatus Omnitrophota bacterium]
MVDVSEKTPTVRRAIVEGGLRLSPEAFDAMQRQTLGKGDPLTVAKIAAIQAAKRTAELIPLCHPLPIEHVNVRFVLEPAMHTVQIVCETTTTAKTGVEMEAFVAVSVAA